MVLVCYGLGGGFVLLIWLLRGFGVDSGDVCLAGWGGRCCLLAGWGGFGGFTCDRFRVCVWLDALVLIVFVDLVCGMLRVGFGACVVVFLVF